MSYYERLGSSSVEAAFDDDWREEVENIVRDCIELSVACEDNIILDREIDSTEISRCLGKLKNNKTGGSDGLVGELLKYGGSGMVDLLQQFSVICREEIVPPQWREGLIVNLFKKGDKEDPCIHEV